MTAYDTALDRAKEASALAENARLRAVNVALLSELQAAHLIIRNALQLMTSEQKAAWARVNDAADLVECGTTRAHERQAVIEKAGGRV